MGLVVSSSVPIVVSATKGVEVGRKSQVVLQCGQLAITD